MNNVKEFVIKDEPHSRFRVRQWKCQSPKGLYALDFIREGKNNKGEIIQNSTFNFFLTKSEIDLLCEGLQK
jgi:hypothetical protein